MEQFTPISALLGGLLIGLAATLFVLFNGRIAGISGILGGLLRPAGGDISWRIAFIAGLLAAAPIYALAAGGLPEITVEAPVPVLIVGGLLVGLGTQIGAGCTSGHGVCGIAQLSIRSLVATGVFMAAAIATVFVVCHAGGF
jgi:uncharacterized protein